MEPVEIDVLLQRPIPIGIVAADGSKETIQLPRLGTEDLLPWLDELSAERKAAMRTSFAKLKLDARQLADAEFSAEVNSRAVITDLNLPAQTPAGTRRILTLSLAAGDLSTDKQRQVLDTILKAPRVAYELAIRLSGLFATGEQRPPQLDPQQKAAEDAAKAFPGANLGAGPLGVPAEAGQPTPAPASPTTG